MALDAFELEVRRLPGVVAFGVENVEPPDSGTDEVQRHVYVVVDRSVGESAAAERMRKDVARLANGHIDDDLVVHLRAVDGEAWPDPPSESGGTLEGPLHRPRIEAVIAGDRGASVHLERNGEQVVGAAGGAGLVSVAEATLDGLRKLGAYIPFRVKAAMRLAIEGEVSVVVVLAGVPGTNLGDRRGVAQGDAPAEAAAKATLHALNRLLVDAPVGPN